MYGCSCAPATLGTYQISSECAFFSIIFKFKNTDETSKILYVNCKRCFFFSLSFNISRTSTFQAINIVVIRLLIFVLLFVLNIKIDHENENDLKRAETNERMERMERTTENHTICSCWKNK